MKSSLYTMIVAIIITTYSPTPSFSQDTDSEAVGGKKLSVGIGFPDSSQRFQGHIGIGIGLVPEYEGSDDYGVTALPLVDIRKPGVFFIKGASINPNDGLAGAGVTILHFSYSENSSRGAQLVLGPFVRFHGGRDEDDSNTLDGLGDIDPSAGVGGFMEFNAGPLLTNLTMSSQDVGDDKDGFLVTFDTKYTFKASDKLAISTGLSISWADDDYMQGLFGVTNTQAVRSGLRRFDSEAGFKDAGIQLHASYALSTHLSFYSQVGYWRLLNDAADSPIVADEGSDNQVRGLLGLLYRF